MATEFCEACHTTHNIVKEPCRPREHEKPFMVQAHRTGQFTQWFTDSRHLTLDTAIAAAEQLHRIWGRKVRVQDQEAKVHLQLPTPKRGGRVKKPQPVAVIERRHAAARKKPLTVEEKKTAVFRALEEQAKKGGTK